MTQNTNGVNAATAGSVICTPEQVALLHWTPNKSQLMTPLPKSGKILWSNRSAFQDNDQWYVVARGGQRIPVKLVSAGRYEVI